MAPLRRILIANRGEIAVRIIRTCRAEGLEVVVVYSEADQSEPHVKLADQAIPIGKAPAAESYLNIANIIDAARISGADAIHPGYGFLAERADFAAAVIDAGLTFVGPSPDVMRSMGVKTEARKIMEAAGVPVVPGNSDPLESAAEGRRVAEAVGLPVLLKAAAGGGGKGMRLVTSMDDLEPEFERATSEAEKSFGDGSVYIERYIDRPRHVEIQLLADGRGNVRQLGERECSIQRRHQKLIEEAPSPAVDGELRGALGRAACSAALAVGYQGAGTVEFLLAPDGKFYFLEMNTRIQVEHPITEMIFGIDLVRWQLKIASGQELDLPEHLVSRGHAIECRIIAEDPTQDFMPSPGVIEYLEIPTGPGVRWDGGVVEGCAVGLYYDPLIAKLVVWGEDREQAIGRMRVALDELTIVGIKTSQPFHRSVMRDPGFCSGSYHTGFVAESADAWCELSDADSMHFALAAALVHKQDSHRPPSAATRGAKQNLWATQARREALRNWQQ
ncbi:MAG: acetyl-CoA carboxylase biotin carboxylase subunit [Gemmatimonadetes bacterium]|nr:acetyl-CoA carboxylase biotin carboxylase subunit [Gemmatimonadota bacterium]